jgi:hypothetical protein
VGQPFLAAAAFQAALAGQAESRKTAGSGGFKKKDIENRIVVTENPPIPADSSASGCRKMANRHR